VKEGGGAGGSDAAEESSAARRRERLGGAAEIARGGQGLSRSGRRESMEIHIIGSGTCVPQADRSSPSCLVRVAGSNVLVDAGTGTMRRLMEGGFHYSEIDYLFFTHIHPDHTHDLVPFLFATKHTPGYTRTRDLHIVGPPGFEEFYRQVMDIYGKWTLADSYAIEVTEMAEESRSFGGWEVSTTVVEHAVPCLAYRFSDGRAAAVVSGDTEYCEAIVRHAEGADALVIECSFPDSVQVEGHLTPRTASQIAREAHCKRLIITHIYPVATGQELAEACRKGFGGEVTAAQDLLRIVL